MHTPTPETALIELEAIYRTGLTERFMERCSELTPSFPHAFPAKLVEMIRESASRSPDNACFAVEFWMISRLPMASKEEVRAWLDSALDPSDDERRARALYYDASFALKEGDGERAVELMGESYDSGFVPAGLALIVSHRVNEEFDDALDIIDELLEGGECDEAAIMLADMVLSGEVDEDDVDWDIDELLFEIGGRNFTAAVMLRALSERRLQSDEFAELDEGTYPDLIVPKNLDRIKKIRALLRKTFDIPLEVANRTVAAVFGFDDFDDLVSANAEGDDDLWEEPDEECDEEELAQRHRLQARVFTYQISLNEHAAEIVVELLRPSAARGPVSLAQFEGLLAATGREHDDYFLGPEVIEEGDLSPEQLEDEARHDEALNRISAVLDERLKATNKEAYLDFMKYEFGWDIERMPFDASDDREVCGTANGADIYVSGILRRPWERPDRALSELVNFITAKRRPAVIFFAIPPIKTASGGGKGLLYGGVAYDGQWFDFCLSPGGLEGVFEGQRGRRLDAEFIDIFGMKDVTDRLRRLLAASAPSLATKPISQFIPINETWKLLLP